MKCLKTWSLRRRRVVAPKVDSFHQPASQQSNGLKNRTIPFQFDKTGVVIRTVIEIIIIQIRGFIDIEMKRSSSHMVGLGRRVASVVVVFGRVEEEEGDWNKEEMMKKAKEEERIKCVASFWFSKIHSGLDGCTFPLSPRLSSLTPQSSVVVIWNSRNRVVILFDSCCFKCVVWFSRETEGEEKIGVCLLRLLVISFNGGSFDQNSNGTPDYQLMMMVHVVVE